MLVRIRMLIAFAAVLFLGCADHPRTSRPLPASVLRELDAIREVTKAAHEEYDRLSTAIVFPNDTMKKAAADWQKRKDFEWQIAQMVDLRARRLGVDQSVFDLLVVANMGSEYVEAEPSVFVERTYYPKASTHELTSLAKLASIREQLDAARARLIKALLADEQSLTASPPR